MLNREHIFNYYENDKFHTNILFKVLNKELKSLSLEFILIGNKNKILRKNFQIKKLNDLVTIKLKDFSDEILEIGEYGILIIFTKRCFTNYLFKIHPKNYFIKTSYTSLEKTSIKEISTANKGIFSIENLNSKDVFILLINPSFKYLSFDLCHIDKNAISLNYSQRVEINPWNSQIIKLDKRKLEKIKKDLLDFHIQGLAKCFIKNLLIFYI